MGLLDMAVTVLVVIGLAAVLCIFALRMFR